MIPQIQAIADLSFEQKLALVKSGHAFIDEADNIYMSLEAVDNLGRAVIAQNPFVVMATEMQSKGEEVRIWAEPTPLNTALAWQLAAMFTTAVYDSIKAGIPLQKVFSHITECAAHELEPNVEKVLADWKLHCLNADNRSKQENINGAA